MRKINLKKCPVDPARFDILNIESKKNLISDRRRALRRAFRVSGWAIVNRRWLFLLGDQLRCLEDEGNDGYGAEETISF